MAYALVDVDVTRPLPSLHLSSRESGTGVLVRKKGRPVGFFLASLPAGAQLDGPTFGRLIAAHIAPEILRSNIEDELVGERVTPPRIDLTVAVCTRDRADLLKTCLESILRLERAEGRRFDVLVVDNAPSTDATRQLVAAMSAVRYVLEPRPGLDFARNRALAEVTTEVIAFVDDDAVVDGGWLSGLDHAWALDPDAVAVTGLVLPLELATEAQVVFERSGGFRRGLQTDHFLGQTRDRSPRYPTWAAIFGTGCNMAFRVEEIRRLGGFDEALDTGPALPGGGDLDMFYRVIRAGHPLVYEPRALVFHRHRREREALRHQYWTWGTSFMAFLHKAYRGDPEMRGRVRHTMVSWLWGGLTEAGRSLGGRSPLTLDLVLAQLAGGVLTVPWMYPVSRARVARIRRQHATS